MTLAVLDCDVCTIHFDGGHFRIIAHDSPVNKIGDVLFVLEDTSTANAQKVVVETAMSLGTANSCATVHEDLPAAGHDRENPQEAAVSDSIQSLISESSESDCLLAPRSFLHTG